MMHQGPGCLFASGLIQLFPDPFCPSFLPSVSFFGWERTLKHYRIRVWEGCERCAGCAGCGNDQRKASGLGK